MTLVHTLVLTGTELDTNKGTGRDENDDVKITLDLDAEKAEES